MMFTKCVRGNRNVLIGAFLLVSFAYLCLEYLTVDSVVEKQHGMHGDPDLDRKTNSIKHKHHFFSQSRLFSAASSAQAAEADEEVKKYFQDAEAERLARESDDYHSIKWFDIFRKDNPDQGRAGRRAAWEFIKSLFKDNDSIMMGSDAETMYEHPPHIGNGYLGAAIDADYFFVRDLYASGFPEPSSYPKSPTIRLNSMEVKNPFTPFHKSRSLLLDSFSHDFSFSRVSALGHRVGIPSGINYYVEEADISTSVTALDTGRGVVTRASLLKGNHNVKVTYRYTTSCGDIDGRQEERCVVQYIRMHNSGEESENITLTRRKSSGWHSLFVRDYNSMGSEMYNAFYYDLGEDLLFNNYEIYNSSFVVRTSNSSSLIENNSIVTLASTIPPRSITIAKHSIVTVPILQVVIANGNRDKAISLYEKLFSHLSFDADVRIMSPVVVSFQENDEEPVAEQNLVKTANAFVNSAFYNLRTSYQSNNTGGGNGGLAYNCYHGLDQWTMDTLHMPAILPFDKNAAKTMLDNRYQKIIAATSSLLNEPESSKRIHVGGDVVLALEKFYETTHDNAWLLNTAFPITKRVADFYTARAYKQEQDQPNRFKSAMSTFRSFQKRKDQDDGKFPGYVYVIDKVIPPDARKDSGSVKNCIYTNSVAKRTIKFALRATHILMLLGYDVDSLFFSDEGDVTSVQAHLARWTEVAEGIVLPFNENSMRFDEYSGYNPNLLISISASLLSGFSLKQPQIFEVAKSTLEFYIRHEQNYQHDQNSRSGRQIGFGRVTSSDDERQWVNSIYRKKTHLEYTPEGISQSLFIFHYLHFLHDKESADRFFRKLLLNNNNSGNPFFSLGGDYFASGCSNSVSLGSSFLQSVIYGYVGINYDQEILSIDPVLPLTAKSMSVKGLTFVDVTFDFEYSVGGGLVLSNFIFQGEKPLYILGCFRYYDQAALPGKHGCNRGLANAEENAVQEILPLSNKNTFNFDSGFIVYLSEDKHRFINPNENEIFSFLKHSYPDLEMFMMDNNLYYQDLLMDEPPKGLFFYLTFLFVVLAIVFHIFLVKLLIEECHSSTSLAFGAERQIKLRYAVGKWIKYFKNKGKLHKRKPSDVPTE
eukprot:Nk52_evm14s158 gene=Nk52_evmTU14s158